MSVGVERLDSLPRATCYRTHTQPDEGKGVFGAVWLADVKRECAQVEAGTKGMTPDRIKRIVQDADYALTALEQGDTENALMALRRGFQRGPVRLRAQAEAERERLDVERVHRVTCKGLIDHEAGSSVPYIWPCTAFVRNYEATR